ncbi:MAG TPA: ATP-dependent DNA helicase PcrA, partial [Acidimicrobiales bacterium]|nr:ATP-dependent DNA helicase PcrA [Acidimicrobiales bacterium]
PPSRFVKELPEHLVQVIESSPRNRLGGGRGLATRPRFEGRERIVDAAMRAGRGTTPVRTKGADQLGLRTGDDVVHASWGEGVIIDMIGAGDRAEVVVRFPDVGEKRLMLAWAPLKRA